jgi:hypothetical protein
MMNNKFIQTLLKFIKMSQSGLEYYLIFKT